MDNDGQYTITLHVGYLCRSIPRCAWWLFSDGPYRRLCEAHSGSGRVCRQIRTQVCNVVCSAPDTDILLHPFLDQPHSASPNHSTCVHRAQENHSDQRTLQRHVKEKKNHIHLWHYANSLELHKHTSLEVNNKSRARHVLNNLMTVFLCNTVVMCLWCSDNAGRSSETLWRKQSHCTDDLHIRASDEICMTVIKDSLSSSTLPLIINYKDASFTPPSADYFIAIKNWKCCVTFQLSVPLLDNDNKVWERDLTK